MPIWCSRGACLVRPQCARGAYLARPWCVRNARLARLQCASGSPVVRARWASGSPMVRIWPAHGARLARPWCARGACLAYPRPPHLAPRVWTTKPPGFPCFHPRLSWVQGLPMRPISPWLSQGSKELTVNTIQIVVDLTIGIKVLK